jgi:hypothetical protein
MGGIVLGVYCIVNGGMVMTWYTRGLLRTLGAGVMGPIIMGDDDFF